MGYIRECVGCNNRFDTDNFKQMRCRKDCNRSKDVNVYALQRLAHDLTFVGVDGESVNRPDGGHDYVMLSVGDKTLFNDGERLTFEQIMRFLWECHTEHNKNTVFVGFFLGYDFTQWERLLPENVARVLLNSALRKSNVNTTRLPDPVVYEGWEFDTLNNRRWKVRPHNHLPSLYNDKCRNRTCSYVFPMSAFETVQTRYGEMEWVPPSTPGAYSRTEYTWRAFVDPKPRSDWMFICDTGPFWQTSFLNVINPTGWNEPVCTEQEYETIKRGKNERATVYNRDDNSYRDDMAKYNVLENAVLARCTSRLNTGFVDNEISIRLDRDDWYGPGRAAQVWMNMLSRKSSVKAEDIYPLMPEWAYNAAQASYYGGWFEQPIHGHIGDAWEYDINSAYPFIIARLPCLLHGTWDHGSDSNYGVEGITLVRAAVSGRNPYLGVMPHRDSYGRISRPHLTKGWHFLSEIQASINAGLTQHVEVEEWVTYRPCQCPPPFNDPAIGIEKMYQMRLAVGKNTPQGKGLKLVYNSAYGKTAQSVGNPRFGNPFYASMITSGTRSMILDAIATHPVGAAAVTMIATDGVYFTSPHNSLPLSKTELGAWDETPLTGLTQLMPGVYWTDESRRKVAVGQTPKLKSRGISAKDIALVLDDLDGEWDQTTADLRYGKFRGWPSINLKVGFAVTSAKSALHRGKWDTAGTVAHNTSRRVSSDPSSKRNPIPYLDDNYIRTPVHPTGPTLETVPYSKAFGRPDDDGIITGSNINPDGKDDLAPWTEFFTHGVVP